MPRKHQYIGGIIGGSPFVTNVEIDLLVVGAGSARSYVLNAQHWQSGGNGGSIIRRTAFKMELSQTYAITVGIGPQSPTGISQATEHVGPDGGSTSFDTLTAAGGVAPQANQDAHSHANKTSADIDGTVTYYNSAGGTGNSVPGASGAGAGGSASPATAGTGAGAAYSYAVNGTTVNANISAGGNWNATISDSSSVANGIPYGRGGEGGYNVQCPGGNGVVYVAYPTSLGVSYTWSGAAGDLVADTSTVAGYTVLRFTGGGDFSVTV